MKELLLKGMSKDQANAITSAAKFIRVIASPGSGKTETLTRRIVWLLTEKEILPKNIVAFTFTEKAAQEMKERVYDRVEQFGNKNLVNTLGKMFIGTIHAYAMQILHDYCDYGHYDMMDEHQEIAFLIWHGFEIGVNKPDRYANGSYTDKCRNFLENIEVIHNEQIPLDKIEAYSEDCAKFIEDTRQYHDKLDEEHLMTLGRIIPLAIKHLKSENILKKLEISNLLVDEFQDINNAQYELIKRLSESADLFIVGDARQTIYQWRGSDCSCFEKFHEFAETHDIHLSENHRSTVNIIEAANQFSNTLEGDYYLMDGTRADLGVSGYFSCANPTEEAEFITEKIKQFHEKGFAYSDIAILLRAVKTSAKPFIASFRANDIPFNIRGRTGLFSRSEIQTLGAIFAWLFKDGFWKDIDQSNYGNSLEGEDILQYALDKWRELTEEMEINFDQNTLEFELKKIKSKVLEGRIRESEYDHIIALYYDILSILGFKNLSYINKEHIIVMANLGRFSNILTDFETPQRRHGNNPEWQRFLKSLNFYLDNYASKEYSEWMAEEMYSLDAVQITTIHQAKGLEWPIVFIPALTKKRFPSSNTGREKFWKVPENFFNRALYEGTEDDERRLFYVAITRAKDYLFLSHHERTEKQTAKISPFLGDILDHLEKSPDYNSIKPLRSISRDKRFFTFTVGDVVRYQHCPYRFLLNHLWEYQPPLSIFLGYGKDLHYILRRVGEAIKEGANPDYVIEEYSRKYFMLPFMGKELNDTLLSNVINNIKGFFHKFSDELGVVEEVESRIEYLLEEESPTKVTIKGVIDLLTTKNGLAIRDYKTKEEESLFDDANMQLRLYTEGLNTIGYPVNSAGLAYIDNCKLENIDVSTQALQEASQKAKTSVQAIIDKKFHPKKDIKKCKKCDYSRICCHA